MFAARLQEYNDSTMLNICDIDILDARLTDGDIIMHVARSYYGQMTVDENKARRLLQDSAIINMAGERTVALAVSMGIGAAGGVRRISGVPFLIVFRM